jgi:ATP-dependent Clp protease protease subunit
MTIEFKAKGTAGEIWLYDEIGGSFFSEGVTAKTFQRELSALGKVNTIELRINSPGGNVFEGLTIYNQLKAHPAKSIIAMAGDTINIAGNAMMMIHDPYGMAMGDAEEMRRTATLLDQIKGNLTDTYSARTGNNRAKVDEWMSAETWFTAQDAVQFGFADAVVQELRVAAHFDLDRFRNVPASLRKAAATAQAAKRDINVVRLAQQAERIQTAGSRAGIPLAAASTHP